MPLRVLVVDDEPDIRTIAQLALEGIAGWEVRTAASGQAALDLARSESYDVVLLDVMMPGMDGLMTHRELKALENPPPTIFVTAKSQRQELQAYLSLGACGVIQKPFDPVTLGDEVSRILARAR
ncbi:MAG: response regulator [Deltaproteobacteria bacterium]|nr:response regulator [Deltaproteobacteria bacterium]